VRTDQSLELVVTVDRDAVPVNGRVVAGGAERTFAGWTELFIALTALIDRPKDQLGAEDL
jgi:hypothetical protein